MKNRDLKNLLNRAAAALEDLLLPHRDRMELTMREIGELVEDLCEAAKELDV